MYFNSLQGFHHQFCLLAHYIVYSIGEANKENYTQLAKTVYEIVYNLCNLLIFSVFCGA